MTKKKTTAEAEFRAAVQHFGDTLREAFLEPPRRKAWLVRNRWLILTICRVVLLGLASYLFVIDQYGSAAALGALVAGSIVYDWIRR